jgi:DNA-binding FadR family transcriptional regulator
MSAPVPSRRQPVQQVADTLRKRIFACPAGEQIGSLNDLAHELGVGIVSVQQAARILEFEGLLEVRRGPGGGYFGRRPDLATLERTISAYWRSEPASLAEVLDMTSLLFNELCAAAARCNDPALHNELRTIAAAISACEKDAGIGALEGALQDQLFRMVNRPFFQLITHIALSMAVSEFGHSGGLAINFGLERWRESRRVIIDAILRRDPELARFEANRRNRQVVMNDPLQAGLSPLPPDQAQSAEQPQP